MERLLAGVFFALALTFLTFVAYLQVNSVGILIRESVYEHEIQCQYFTGITTVTMWHPIHRYRRCPWWHEVW